MTNSHHPFFGFSLETKRTPSHIHQPVETTSHLLFSSVPWNETVQEQIADILFGMVDSYVFVDLSRNSPTPEFPMQVHIVQLLVFVGAVC